MNDEQSIVNGKYVVFKAENWDDFKEGILSEKQVEYMETALVKDAVVIRRQDIFASSGFYAYAQAIHTAIEMVEQLGFPSITKLRELREIAEYFMNQGDAAKLAQHKLPD